MTATPERIDSLCWYRAVSPVTSKVSTSEVGGRAADHHVHVARRDDQCHVDVEERELRHLDMERDDSGLAGGEMYSFEARRLPRTGRAIRGWDRRA